MPPRHKPPSDSDLLTCVAANTLKGYLAATGKAGKHNAGELAKELTRKQLTDACAALEREVTQAVGALQEAQVQCEDEEARDDDMMLQLGEVLQVLKGAALLGLGLLQACHAGPPDALLNAAAALHDNCLLAVDDLSELQDPVCRLCCAWWELQAPGKEQLMAQTLPYILIRAEASGKVVDVKTCFTMREAFALLDFEDPTIVDVKRLLLQASFSPAFLHRTEGRRFLASMFGLDRAFVGELTAVIKNQIPSGRKSVLDAYGEILFRAWKETTGPCLLELENTCVQELMQAAIYASTQPLAAALRVVLKGLHSEKRVAGVDALLLRLYQPILFRAFAANNAAVRLNALNLLLDAFPLMDPDAGPEDMEETLTLQFDHLRACLVDDCPLVRVAAVGGVSSLLNLFWELIPASTTAWLVSRLTGELAFDMSWPAVRAAVLEGLLLLVDNPHAQPVLKKALPQLAALLSDPSLKVREAMASLLSALSSSRALHFYDVVPVDMLLDVMASDAPSVSQKIQAILVPSYFPSPQEGSARVAMLLKANPAAGQAFCQYLVSSYTAAAYGHGGFRASVPIEHVLQLALDLKSHLLATCAGVLAAVAAVAAAAGEGAEGKEEGPSRKKKKGGKGAGAKGKKAATTGKRRKQQVPADAAAKVKEEGDVAAGTDQEEEVVIVEEPETPETWSAIAAGLAAVCHGLAGAVGQEQCGQGDLLGVFEEDELLLLYEGCPTDEARSSVLKMVSLLPFLPAAAAVRSRLLSDVASGKLLPNTLGDASSLKDQGAPASASLSLSEAVRSLCSHACGSKLAAMVMSALGLRPSGTIHVPVGKPSKKRAANPDVCPGVDDACCLACGDDEPEESLLLCDGCDGAYHMQCVRPALVDVPQGAWFCHRCEQDVQLCSMSTRQALACVSATIGLPEGRTCLATQGQFAPLLEGLRGLAHSQGQLLLSALSSGGRADAGKDSTTDAVGLYCRSALHLALTTMLDPGSAAEGEEAAGADGGRPTSDEALTAMVNALNEALEMCEEVLESCQRAQQGQSKEGGGKKKAGTGGRLKPSLAARCLEFVGAVLGVVGDAQQLTLLDLGAGAGGSGGDGDGGQQVVRFCKLGAAVAAVVTGVAEADGGEEGAGTEEGTSSGAAAAQQPVAALGRPAARVRSALGHVLAIARQLVASIGAAERAGQAAAAGQAQRQQAVAAEAAAGRAGGAAAALGQLDGLTAQVLVSVMRPGAHGLLQAVRQPLSSLLAALLDHMARGAALQAWLGAVVAAVGAAVAECDDASMLEEGEEEEAGREGVRKQRKGGRGGGRLAKQHEDKAAEKEDGAEEVEVVGEVAGVEVKEEEQEGGAALGPKAGVGGGALVAADPAAGLLCRTVLALVRGKAGAGAAGAAAAAKLSDCLLGRLASVASEAWRGGGVPSVLGAVYMMGLLGFKGVQGRRLRLTGTEVNALLKLEMLQKEVKGQQQEQGQASDIANTEASLQKLGALLDKLLA